MGNWETTPVVMVESEQGHGIVTVTQVSGHDGHLIGYRVECSHEECEMKPVAIRQEAITYAGNHLEGHMRKAEKSAAQVWGTTGKAQVK